MWRDLGNVLTHGLTRISKSHLSKMLTESQQWHSFQWNSMDNLIHAYENDELGSSWY